MLKERGLSFELVAAGGSGLLLLGLLGRPIRDLDVVAMVQASDQGPQSRHFTDLKALHPSKRDLTEAARWARTHDPSEGFRGELHGLLRSMGLADVAETL